VSIARISVLNNQFSYVMQVSVPTQTVISGTLISKNLAAYQTLVCVMLPSNPNLASCCQEAHHGLWITEVLCVHFATP